MSNVEISLPVGAVSQWMRGSLREGPSLSLAKSVEQRFDWNNATYLTFVDESVTNLLPNEFTVGGKVRAASADNWIMSYLSKTYTTDSFVVVEDWRAQPSSDFLTNMNMPAFFYKSDVYYVMRGPDPRTHKHWRKIFSNVVPAFHAFVIRGSVNIEHREAISPATLWRLANSVRTIICGAYDGEGYILANAA